jgi:hypothetical protein
LKQCSKKGRKMWKIKTQTKAKMSFDLVCFICWDKSYYGLSYWAMFGIHLRLRKTWRAKIFIFSESLNFHHIILRSLVKISASGHQRLFFNYSFSEKRFQISVLRYLFPRGSVPKKLWESRISERQLFFLFSFFLRLCYLFFLSVVIWNSLKEDVFVLMNS